MTAIYHIGPGMWMYQQHGQLEAVSFHLGTGVFPGLGRGLT